MNQPSLPTYCPGPWHDAVARMFISGVNAFTVAQFFRTDIESVTLAVRWVCEANMRAPRRGS